MTLSSLKVLHASNSVRQGEASPDAQAELATAIDDLLDTVGSKFQAQSKDILKQSKLITPASLQGFHFLSSWYRVPDSIPVDLMAARLDELEAQAKTNLHIDSNRDSASS
jgi:hypothetical protein